MGKAYFAREDVVRRLHDTICLYHGFPYYVNADVPDGGTKVRLYPLAHFYAHSKDHKSRIVDYTDEKFDYKQYPLGYGYSKKAGGVYFSRMPDRKQQQGLSSQNLRINGKPSHSGYFLSEALENCILGNYPTLEDAIDLSKRGTLVAPFHRRMAVSTIDRGLICLKYRLRSVGILEGKKSFKLLDNRDKEFLRSVITKEGVSVT